MADLVESRKDITDNITTLYNYRVGTADEVAIFASLIRKGHVLIALKSGIDQYQFAPSRFRWI